MERLIHLSTTNKHMDWFGEDWQAIQAFVKKHQLDGIELGLTNDYPIEKIPSDVVRGVHLKFYPMWLEFWREDHAALKELFPNEQAIVDYYGGNHKQVLVEDYRYQYKRAKALGAKYMVFHVSHIRPTDSFSWEFSYTDKEVMQATIELVNEAFPIEEDGPTLLFENLWWPGLTYMDPALTKYFIEQIQYPNKGYLVDVSHLTLMNLEIGSAKACYQHIKKVIDALGETKKWIKGVHLNQTLPKYYRKQNFVYALEKYEKASDPKQKHRVLMQHVQKLDPHQPFADPIAKDILAAINPMYCVYETAPTNIHELAYFIKQQDQALGLQKY